MKVWRYYSRFGGENFDPATPENGNGGKIKVWEKQPPYCHSGRFILYPVFPNRSSEKSFRGRDALNFVVSFGDLLAI